jgi:phosphoribosylformylglycinamidine synthase subunit PurL
MPTEISLSDATSAEQFQAAPSISIAEGAELSALLKQHKIAPSEFEKILKIKGKAPSLTELGVFSAMWSEHCSYKSSRVHLKRFPTTGKNVVVGPGENAGVVRLEGRMCIAFKMESHNHPSFIEPYQGASTGVGGILRDVFCMGARPFANLNCLRFGDKSHPRTAFLVPRAVKGIGDYGNCVGVPTVGGSISYDKSYNGNCLVNAMTLGLIRDDRIFKGFATGVGNLVVYVGSATGRDGIHGATMASDSFAGSSDTSSPGASKTTIQVGDPFAEKLLLEATLEVLDKNLVIGIQDMGAAGLTSSSFEMAGRAENGVYFDLDRVPVRANEMTAYEIMLSESQERMLMVIEPKKWPELKQVLGKWQLAHAVIGVVTNTGRMQVSAKGVLEIDLPVSPLTDDAPVYNRPVAPPKVKRNFGASANLIALKDRLDSDFDFAQSTLFKALRDTGSKQKIYEQFDRHIGTKSVLGPEHGGAAVMWIRSDETKETPFLGVAISAGCNERRVKNTPFIGAAEAVLKCVREISAAGGRPLAVTDCLNFGSAEDPHVMREFSDSVDGISAACHELDIPVVSGNVSLYNSTDGISIHPTPMIGVVGRVEDVRAVTPAVLTSSQGPTDVYLLAPFGPENGRDGDGLKGSPNLAASLVASLAAKVNGIECVEGELPAIDWTREKAAFDSLEALRSNGCLAAVRSVGEGGVGLGVLKMVGEYLSEKPTIKIKLKHSLEFFGEGGPRYLIVLAQDMRIQAEASLSGFGMALDAVGHIIFDQKDLVHSYFGNVSTNALAKEFSAAQPIGGLG